MAIAQKLGLVILLVVTFTTLFLLQTSIIEREIFQTSPTNQAAPVLIDQALPRYWILRSDEKCLGSSDGYHLGFLICDPTQNQTFHFLDDGNLEHSRTGLCVSLEKGTTAPGPLSLGHCSTGTSFQYVNGSYLQFNDSIQLQGPRFCLSASHDKVFVSKCTNASSKVSLVEEATFIVRRKALLWPLPENNSDCNFPACAINKRALPVELLPSSRIDRCYNLSQCVTVVIKTARRPNLVLRLVRSLRDVKGYDLPIIAYDDGLESYSEEIMSEIASFSNLRYIIGDKHDLGISVGRNLALKLVRTKYFLLCDDDLIFTEQSDIELLAEILDTTDASLAGGSQGSHFAGYFHFTSLNDHDELTSKQILYYYQGQCYHENETIGGFPRCMRCDATSNFFMAKTTDILDVGCWSEELKIAEHKDLFLKLKAAGKKVVWCPRVKILNRKIPKKEAKDSGYKALRKYRKHAYQTIFNNIWNIDLLQRVMQPNSSTFIKRKEMILN